MDSRFNEFIETVLLNSGWYKDRNVESEVLQWQAQIKASDKIEMFPIAEKILREFGGIKVQRRENYSEQSFEINPTLAIYEGDRFVEYSEKIGTEIYPLGEAFGGYYFLGVGTDGRVFWVGDGLFIVAEDFDEALSRMILGEHPELV